MVFTWLNLVLIAFCLLGCGITSWRKGRAEGIQASVQYFIDEGIIEVVEKDGN